MSCSSPFKIDISSPVSALKTQVKATDTVTTSSFGGLQSPAHYIDWPIPYYCGPDHWWDYLDPADYCIRYERKEIWPAITWIPSSDITYGISFTDTIECYGALIKASSPGGIGMISSWIIKQLRGTFKGEIAGHSFSLLNDDLLVPEIEFTARVMADSVSLYAEIPLYSTGTDLNLSVFKINLSLSFDILICVVPNSSIKFAVDMDIGISAMGSKSLNINPSIAFPLISAGDAGSILIKYLEAFADTIATATAISVISSGSSGSGLTYTTYKLAGESNMVGGPPYSNVFTGGQYIKSDGYCLVLEKNGSLKLIKGDSPGGKIVWSFESGKSDGTTTAQWDSTRRAFTIVRNGQVIWDAPMLPANTTVGFGGSLVLDDGGYISLQSGNNETIWKAQAGDHSNGVQVIGESDDDDTAAQAAADAADAAGI